MEQRNPTIKARINPTWFVRVRFLSCAKTVIGFGLALFAVWSLGCSSPPQAGSSDPTKKEIRSDADRFFNKVEKEEEAKSSKTE